MNSNGTSEQENTCVIIDVQALERFNSWIITPAAKQALNESHQQAEEATAILSEARKVDADSLHKMVTL
jgi:hypothetical protein